jgi:hypothetical protein
MLQVRGCGSQEFRAVPEPPESLVARGAQQGAHTLAARLGGVGTADVVMVDGKGPAVAVRPLAYGARAPLGFQHLRVTPTRHPIKRPALRVPGAVAAVSLQAVRSTSEASELSNVEPDKASAALLLTALVPVGRLGLSPVRQRSQFTSHAALPVVARTQPLADVPACTARKFAPPDIPRRAVMHAVRARSACVSVTLPPLVMHGAQAPGTHAHRAVASIDGAGGHVHASAPSGERKEAP